MTGGGCNISPCPLGMVGDIGCDDRPPGPRRSGLEPAGIGDSVKPLGREGVGGACENDPPRGGGNGICMYLLGGGLVFDALNWWVYIRQSDNESQRPSILT